jgi:ABC-type transport system involved in cytochrome c biogenesis permease component
MKTIGMKTLEIIFENETKEVECDDIELHDNILHVIVQGKVTQMWNMCKVVGVVLHDS